MMILFFGKMLFSHLKSTGDCNRIESSRLERAVSFQAFHLHARILMFWNFSDYNFGLPSFPWVNGRDFAGIVVKGPQSSSRVTIGDAVIS